VRPVRRSAACISIGRASLRHTTKKPTVYNNVLALPRYSVNELGQVIVIVTHDPEDRGATPAAS
jgi:hypothetical protein